MKLFMNQTGFLPDAPKFAVHQCSTPCPFTIYDAITNKPRYTGTTVYHGFDEISGIEACTADFSDLNTPGEYYLVIEKTDGENLSDWSFPFEIRSGLYHPLANDLRKALYYQRCGCALTSKHAGPFTHEACHIDEASLYEDPSVRLEVSGGWHDAGDYGRYVTPAAIAVSHLLWAYELFPEKMQDTVNIPESGTPMGQETNPVAPDLLHEVRYELDWMLKMQRADGGVYHKVTTAHHAPFVMPEADKKPLIVYPVSSMATAMFAASLAQAARIYHPFDSEYASRLLAAACKAQHWLLVNPQWVPFKNPEDCKTGEYGHRGDADHRMWAAIELLRTTKTLSPTDFASLEAPCRDILSRAMADEQVNKTSFGWEEAGALAMLSLVFDLDCTCGADYAGQAKDILLGCADRTLDKLSLTPFAVPLTAQEYFWGSNMHLMCQGMYLVVAHILTKKPSYLTGAHHCLDYLLGKNVVGMSYVSGWGEHSLSNPHNRPTVADGIDAIMPGWVAGGANGRYRDAAAQMVLEHQENQAPMACYADDWLCYSLNEIAIYWNTPAFFVAAYLDA